MFKNTSGYILTHVMGPIGHILNSIFNLSMLILYNMTLDNAFGFHGRCQIKYRFSCYLAYSYSILEQIVMYGYGNFE
jgi:hypothetical protein